MSFSQAEQLYFEMNRTEELSTVGNQLKKYMRSLIIDDILSEGVNVSTKYYPGSFRAIGSKYKVSGVTSFQRMEDLFQTGAENLLLNGTARDKPKTLAKPELDLVQLLIKCRPSRI